MLLTRIDEVKKSLLVNAFGCDQSQVQRELTVGKIDEVKKSLLVNAFGRFPLVLLYCTMGVFIGAVVMTGGAGARIPGAHRYCNREFTGNRSHHTSTGSRPHGAPIHPILPTPRCD